ncbi:MAG: histidine kinase [Ginsengibacter sp.]
MKLSWTKKKWVIILFHILCWTLIFSLPYLLRPSNNDTHAQKMAHDARYDYHYILNCLSWVVLFYLNAYLLIPRFFIKRKYGLYFLSLLVVLAVFGFFNLISFKLLLPDREFQINGLFFFYIFPAIFVLAISSAFKLFTDRAGQDKLAKERETENLKTELSFLRSQVSPHFMFNVLNNMVALARKKSDQLEPSLIKLSSLLRYMLYETDEEKVSLQKEVEYLQSYIDLQKQRFGKNVQINTDIHGIDGNYSIEPMLLIPFVENAFKHGTGMIENAFIDIKLAAINGVLHCTITNKFNNADIEIKDKTSGIGLNNVTRRLNLLYTNNHELLVTEKDDLFIVSLQLNLH